MSQTYDRNGYVIAVQPVIEVTNSLTGIITVTTAGTEVTGDNIANSGGGYILKAHPDNKDTVWVMPVGREKTAGFPLNVGEAIVLNVDNLNLLCFDADLNGEKVCWIKQ